ncbi:MAG: hypothetical protein IJ374_12700 [Lachnospiraceae bacterium]|nr:hypothetical protein [Lachnospiraceae bacterium]
MLFHVFNSQDERRKFGGSAFVEMQFCKLPSGTKVKELVAVSNIDHWQNDSLYIDDENKFYQEYSHVFNCGIYNNLKSGTVDIYGINYYAPSLTDSIIKRILEDRPTDYETLLEWLNMSKAYNGFYILGI